MADELKNYKQTAYAVVNEVNLVKNFKQTAYAVMLEESASQPPPGARSRMFTIMEFGGD